MQNSISLQIADTDPPHIARMNDCFVLQPDPYVLPNLATVRVAFADGSSACRMVVLRGVRCLEMPMFGCSETARRAESNAKFTPPARQDKTVLSVSCQTV